MNFNEAMLHDLRERRKRAKDRNRYWTKKGNITRAKIEETEILICDARIADLLYMKELE